VTDYLTLAEVLAIHIDQIERYGGIHGIRDAGLLESALFRPQTGYYADLLERAAALWESLSQNHSFLDGNKRTAFAVTYTFLAINGANLTASSQATQRFLVGLYDRNDLCFAKVSPWLRQNVAVEESSPHNFPMK
jgi:death on curing protein